MVILKEKYQKLVDAHKTILEFYKYDYELEEAEKTFFEAIEYLKNFQRKLN